MSLKNVIFNRNKIENPAEINLKNIWKFIQGTFFKLILKIPFLSKTLVKESRIEQMEWRRKLVKAKSPECFTRGECYCGCDVEGLIAADPACEQKNLCFPEMMEPAQWREFKTKNNI